MNKQSRIKEQAAFETLMLAMGIVGFLLIAVTL
jgi:hypothetical protein